MNEDEVESIPDRKYDELLDEDVNLSTDGSLDTEELDDSAAEPDETVHVESVEQFSDVTTRDDVVLVDFYADWCGPCNMLEPIVESVAANTVATVAKVDIDQQQGLAAQYGVRSVPTLVLFADGEQVEQLVGMQNEQNLTRLVERYS
ncbi:thioredoxin [Halorussus sp. MSC15.2]|uniref:thioredoxin n=1 Tax=Halorussus sp. MSC15.2 TaxID=2283638 RepID=UPI0013D1394E|nr:thioredoxin [Halorussus sp. MSC15.2]NEU58311.1 thioredoxin [Halorussus sp. MSC15.2]